MDNISVSRINLLHPSIRDDVYKLLEHCFEKKISIRITQGLRSIEEQNALYAQGRTSPGNIVTYAKGGDSWHNYGLAFDFCLLSDDKKNIIWDINKDLNRDGKSDWLQIIEFCVEKGFEWGGIWKSPRTDYPHLQKTFGLKLLEAKNKIYSHDVDKEGYINIP